MNNIFRLPKRKETVTLGDGIKLKGLRFIDGGKLAVVAGKVSAPDLPKGLEITYDVTGDNVILHGWYKVGDEARREQIRANVRDYLLGCMA